MVVDQEARVRISGSHPGLLAVQRRVGSEAFAKAPDFLSLFATRPISQQLQKFFRDLRLVYTATRGDSGRLWASVLFGNPSFIQIPNTYQAVIQPVRHFGGDPARYNAGSAVGMVGVMLENRRRNLLSGKISSCEGEQLTIDVYQALGNCPKYIQVRDLELRKSGLDTDSTSSNSAATGQQTLAKPQLDLIARSDTFFIASAHKASSYESSGTLPEGFEVLHINHKGGYPGFVQGDPSGRLQWGDYIGNNAFSTLGNLSLNPEAGLLFMDFTTGDTLHLSGTTEIHWDETALPGAQRTIYFQTEGWVHVTGALPIHQRGSVHSSPYNPSPPSSLHQASNTQKLKCISTKQESLDVMSFEFELPQHAQQEVLCQPGQFASFDFEKIQPGKTLNRTWTISSPTQQIQQRQAFTISVKKGGLVSSWLFDNMHTGKSITFRGIDGDFTLALAAELVKNDRSKNGVLLVAGGIGITPMRVMLAERLAMQLPITLLYFVRTLQEAPFLEELCEAAKRHQSIFKLAVSVTRPQPQSQTQPSSNPDQEPEATSTSTSTVTEIDHSKITASADLEALVQATQEVSMYQGRITTAMVEKVCPDVRSSSVFQCGPGPMMQLVSSTLQSMGMPMTQVFQEAFTF